MTREYRRVWKCAMCGFLVYSEWISDTDLWENSGAEMADMLQGRSRGQIGNASCPVLVEHDCHIFVGGNTVGLATFVGVQWKVRETNPAP